jgi:hypothetical protein
MRVVVLLLRYCLAQMTQHFTLQHLSKWGHAVAHSVEGSSPVRFPMVSLEFFLHPVSIGNEYFLEGKGGRWVELTTLQLSCADCLEICLFTDCFTHTSASVLPSVLETQLTFSIKGYNTDIWVMALCYSGY